MKFSKYAFKEKWKLSEACLEPSFFVKIVNSIFEVTLLVDTVTW